MYHNFQLLDVADGFKRLLLMCLEQCYLLELVHAGMDAAVVAMVLYTMLWLVMLPIFARSL